MTRYCKDYAAIRDSIKSGDLLLCSGTGVFSKMIQSATKSPWSHVAFILRVDSIDRIMVMESVENIGVRTVPLSSYLSNYNGTRNPYPGRMILARHQDFPESGIATLSQYAVDLLGYRYGSEEIGRIAARIGMDSIGLGTRDVIDLSDRTEFICSEYVYLCFRSIGLEVPFDPRGFIAPKDFAESKKIKNIANIGPGIK